MKKLVFLLIIFVVVNALSCKKDDLTSPVRVDFKFSMSPYQLSGANDFTLLIDKGTISIESIEFDGRRSQGADYYFTSEFPAPVVVELHTGNASQNVYYDIPQGIYDKIEVNLSIAGNKDDTALSLEGTYLLGPEEYFIRFEYSFQELIRINAENKQGGEQIVLSSDSDIEAEIILDVEVLFELVSIDLIANAELIHNQESILLLINNEYNTDIFNLLVARLDNSIQVIFD